MLTVGHYFIFSHVRNKIILKFIAVYTFLRGIPDRHDGAARRAAGALRLRHGCKNWRTSANCVELRRVAAASYVDLDS